MSEGQPPPPPRAQDPAPRDQGYGDQQYREPVAYRDPGYRAAPVAGAPAEYASTTTTVVDAQPVGPAPALMLALGLLVGLLVGLLIAYVLWHSSGS